MSENARDEILARLRTAPKAEVKPRPASQPGEVSWNREAMLEKFTENALLQSAVVHRVADYRQASGKLAEVCRNEGIRRIIASSDEVLARLELKEWPPPNDIEVLESASFRERRAFVDAIFDRAEAGLTGADFAIAESGTLGLVHDRAQPRLVSSAPIMHIAVVPLENLCPTYESAVERIFGRGDGCPSQVTFITGPSMTADIQATPFRGMHGPKKLTIILVG